MQDYIDNAFGQRKENWDMAAGPRKKIIYSVKKINSRNIVPDVPDQMRNTFLFKAPPGEK